MTFRLALAALGLLVAHSVHANPPASPASLMEVRLDQLHPTQPAIGYDQVRYKLGRYAKERSKLFDDFCEANGQGAASHVTGNATLSSPESFTCRDAVGTHRRDMKTVIIGPERRLYLTDGHHTFSSLWEQPGAGPQLKVWVRVTDDFSDSPDMGAFWQRMEKHKTVRLKDGNGQSITAQQLPERLGFGSLQDDPFRAIVYFTRDAAYKKPSSGGVVPEYLEFYWADWLRPQMELSHFDRDSRTGYAKAVETAGKLMVGLDEDAAVGDSGFTARELGAFRAFNRKAFNKTLNGKMAYALSHKQAE